MVTSQDHSHTNTVPQLRRDEETCILFRQLRRHKIFNPWNGQPRLPPKFLSIMHGEGENMVKSSSKLILSCCGGLGHLSHMLSETDVSVVSAVD